MSERDLVTHLVRFAGALREQGIAVDLRGEIHGGTSLTLVDLLDREDVRCALRVAFGIRRPRWELFDTLFDRWWSVGSGNLLDPAPAQCRKATPNGRRIGSRRVVTKRIEAAEDGEIGDLPGYSPDAAFRRKPFEELSSREVDLMEQVLERLALKLATRRSRRFTPTPTTSRGMLDLRRSFRRALWTDGEILMPARRSRPVEKTRLALLCDTSGSMEPYTRFLLAFVLSIRQVARRAEVFVFNTSLTRVTPWIDRGKIGASLDRVAVEVADWSGGTRIGECLSHFVSAYQASAVDHKTIVVILSDGLDRGDPDILADAMRAIHARARKVIWLNPLMGYPRYEPTARGMAAALPFVDHLAAAHTLESLERLIPLLVA